MKALERSRTVAVMLAGLLLLSGCATTEEPTGTPEDTGAATAPSEGEAGTDGAPQEGDGAEARGLEDGAAAEGEALAEGETAPGDEGISRPEDNRVFFAFDSAEVREKGRELIKAHAEYLKANREIRVLLEGHTDERGSREYNLGLGERRAKSVRRLLRVNGVSSSRLEVVSFGEERPLREGDSEEAYAKNRRVRIRYQGEGG